MTKDEIERMCDVLDEADAGCPHCVREIYDHAARVFPEYALQLHARRIRGKGKTDDA